MNRFVYHYCSHYQKSVGAIVYIDGIAQMENRITCMDDYKILKKGIDSPDSDKLIIDSLSFLGMGSQPPIPTWGAMLAESRQYIRILPLLSIVPGIMIM